MPQRHDEIKPNLHMTSTNKYYALSSFIRYAVSARFDGVLSFVAGVLVTHGEVKV